MAKTELKSKNDDLWRTIFAEQAASGLSVASFCKERLLSQNQYYWRKRKLSHQSDAENIAVVSQSDPLTDKLTQDRKDETVFSQDKKADHDTRVVASTESDHRNLFAPVCVKDDQPSSPAADYSDIGSPIEIALRSGAIIRVRRGFDLDTLIQVLDCLETRKC